MTAPGSAITPIQAGSFENAPAWLTYSSGHLSGDAKLPSGYRRVVVSNNGVRSAHGITVDPIALPADASSPWRCAIYAPDGSYIIMNGLKCIPTVGTPVVRLSDNAPSKATVRIPLARGNQNIRSPTFDKWTGGYTGMVKRGMEMTVEYRDADTGLLTMVFRGRIFQIQSGESVEITAYDRLMDLAQFSDQYQPDLASIITEDSSSRTVAGTDNKYEYVNTVGAILGGTAIDKIKIDPRSKLSRGYYGPNAGYTTIPKLLQNLPSYAGATPYNGTRITKVGCYGYGETTGSAVSSTKTITVRAYLYKGDTQVGQVYTKTWTTSHGTYAITTDIDTDWVLDADPSEYWVGLETTVVPSRPDQTAHLMYYTSSTHYTTTRYRQWNGSGWTDLSLDQRMTEFMVEFTSINGTVAVGSMTSSGNEVTVPQSALPPARSADNILSTVDQGVILRLQYTVSGSIGYADIVSDLITYAGLTPNPVAGINLGSCDYYTTTTYDYLDCIREILSNNNYGLRDSIDAPGVISVGPKHTVDEEPIRTITTDPVGTGERIIISHDLTAHWMAEKATVAYITEGSNLLSGYPLAVETDDRLMDESVAEALDSPLRQVIIDTSMGTHSAMARAAGGKMVQLHTNVFEGSVTLAGYRLNLWDLYGSGKGGIPLALDVPEYDAQGVAVPTEMVIGDGATILTLNNIRTPDRSEVANSMKQTADAVSNGSSQLSPMVYIFARVDPRCYTTGLPGTVTSVDLMKADGTVMSSQTNSAFIKTAVDNAGYIHVDALFPPNPSPPWAPYPVTCIKISVHSQANFDIYATVTNTKTVAVSQGIHVDVRFKNP